MTRSIKHQLRDILSSFPLESASLDIDTTALWLEVGELLLNHYPPQLIAAHWDVFRKQEQQCLAGVLSASSHPQAAETRELLKIPCTMPRH